MKKERRVARDLPLLEVTLRKYEKPYNLSKRGLVKKLCLSLGLLNPGDSRDVVVDILYVLLDMRPLKKELRLEELREKVIILREKEKLPLYGIAPSNIRRQLRRLRELYLVTKRRNFYKIAENTALRRLFEDKVERFLIPSTLDRIKEYLFALDERFS